MFYGMKSQDDFLPLGWPTRLHNLSYNVSIWGILWTIETFFLLIKHVIV